MTTKSNPAYSRDINDGWIEICNNNGLSQHVSEPTRGNNILETFFTTHQDLVYDSKVIPGIGDHEGCALITVEDKLKKKN